MTMLLALIFALLSAGSVLWLFPRWKLLDRPDLYGHTREPIPYPAGLAFVLGYLLLGFVLHFPPVFLCLGLVLGLLSFWDDRYRLHYALRLFLQLATFVILGFAGFHIDWVQSPFGGLLDLSAWPWLGFGILVFWGMSLMNAMNWLDEVPGMSLGMTALTCLTIYFLSLREGLHYLDQSLVQSMILHALPFFVLFFFLQWPKPRCLLGDSGSIFFGFMIAVLSLVSGAKLATVLTVLALPMADFFMVIARRMLKKQSPFKGDYSHLHHRLMAASWSNTAILAFYFSLASFMSLLAIYASTPVKFFAVLLFFFGLLLFDLLYLSRFPFDPLIHPHHVSRPPRP